MWLNRKALGLFDILQLSVLIHLKNTDLKSTLLLLHSIYRIQKIDGILGRGVQLNVDDIKSLSRNCLADDKSTLSSYHYCLLSALCLHLIAMLSGVKSSVALGLLKDGGRLHSHAWLIVEDRDVVDHTSQAQIYERIGTFTLDDLEVL